MNTDISTRVIVDQLWNRVNSRTCSHVKICQRNVCIFMWWNILTRAYSAHTYFVSYSYIHMYVYTNILKKYYIKIVCIFKHYFYYHIFFFFFHFDVLLVDSSACAYSKNLTKIQKQMYLYTYIWMYIVTNKYTYVDCILCLWNLN